MKESGSSVLFPPLPRSIRVPFSRPAWNLAAISAMYFTPSLERKLCKELKAFGLADALLVDSGTSAIYLALRDIGIREGDEVVLPSFVCKAVIQATIAAGAKPVYADIGTDFNMTVASVKAAIGKRTKAVIAVHQFGTLCDIRAMRALCEKRSIALIEDAAIPFGIRDGNSPVGSVGDYSVFSFNMGKTITSFGGGLLVKRSGKLSASLQRPRMGVRRVMFFLTNIYYKRFFNRVYYPLLRLRIAKRQEDIAAAYERVNRSPVKVLPARMSRLQAAATVYQLRRLERTLKRQQEIAHIYLRELRGTKHVQLPSGRKSTFTYFPIRAERRYDLSVSLSRAGIETQWTFYPLHMQSRYARYGKRQIHLTMTERLWKEELSLPMGPHLTPEDAVFVAGEIKRFYS